jgi:hypothetical protein
MLPEETPLRDSTGDTSTSIQKKKKKARTNPRRKG